MLLRVRQLDHARAAGLIVPALRDVRDGDELRLRAQQLREFVEQQLAAIVDRRDAQLGAFFLAQHLPGHDVGVVLHGGDEHFVAGADMCARP